MRVVCSFVVAAVLVIGLSNLPMVAAQEKPQTETYPMPKPGPEMEKLKFQLGTWKAAEKHESGPGFSGGEGQGTVTTKLGPGGLSIFTEYKSVGPLGDFTGQGFVAWDAEEKVYKSYWFDNFKAGSFNTVGRWEGQDLVFTGEMKEMGKKYSFKEVYTDITPSSYTLKMYMSEGGPLKLAFTIKATKQ